MERIPRKTKDPLQNVKQVAMLKNFGMQWITVIKKGVPPMLALCICEEDKDWAISRVEMYSMNVEKLNISTEDALKELRNKEITIIIETPMDKREFELIQFDGKANYLLYPLKNGMCSAMICSLSEDFEDPAAIICIPINCACQPVTVKIYEHGETYLLFNLSVRYPDRYHL